MGKWMQHFFSWGKCSTCCLLLLCSILPNFFAVRHGCFGLLSFLVAKLNWYQTFCGIVSFYRMFIAEAHTVTRYTTHGSGDSCAARHLWSFFFARFPSVLMFVCSRDVF